MSKSLLALLFFSFLFAPYRGNALGDVPVDSKVRSATCPTQKISTRDYEAYLRPVQTEQGKDWVAFQFVFRNKSKQPITIAWDDSYYLNNGAQAGKFTMRGRQPLQEETVRPNQIVLHVIWPESNLKQGTGAEEAGSVSPMAGGDQGIQLALKTGEGEFHEDLALNVDNQVRVCGVQPSGSSAG